MFTSRSVSPRPLSIAFTGHRSRSIIFSIAFSTRRHRRAHPEQRQGIAPPTKVARRRSRVDQQNVALWASDRIRLIARRSWCGAKQVQSYNGDFWVARILLHHKTELTAHRQHGGIAAQNLTFDTPEPAGPRVFGNGLHQHPAKTAA